MKNLKVATKLIISFGAVIIMTIACSLVSVIGLKSVHGNVNLMIDTEIKSLLRVKDVEIQVETIGRTVRAGVLEDDNNVETQYINEATAAAATMMEKTSLHIPALTQGSMSSSPYAMRSTRYFPR